MDSIVSTHDIANLLESDFGSPIEILNPQVFFVSPQLLDAYASVVAFFWKIFTLQIKRQSFNMLS